MSTPRTRLGISNREWLINSNTPHLGQLLLQLALQGGQSYRPAGHDACVRGVPPTRPARRLGDKEYQNIVPKVWRQPGHGLGRFWGVHGLQQAIAVVEIAQDAYLADRRIIRRWSRSQASHGDCMRRFPTAVVPRISCVAVRRVDAQTGKVGHRRLRRRRLLCGHGGLAGGYVLVNDGPAFASQLAAALPEG
jgi:hypothetical protein